MTLRQKLRHREHRADAHLVGFARRRLQMPTEAPSGFRPRFAAMLASIRTIAAPAPSDNWLKHCRPRSTFRRQCAVLDTGCRRLRRWCLRRGLPSSRLMVTSLTVPNAGLLVGDGHHRRPSDRRPIIVRVIEAAFASCAAQPAAGSAAPYWSCGVAARCCSAWRRSRRSAASASRSAAGSSRSATDRPHGSDVLLHLVLHAARSISTPPPMVICNRRRLRRCCFAACRDRHAGRRSRSRSMRHAGHRHGKAGAQQSLPGARRCQPVEHLLHWRSRSTHVFDLAGQRCFGALRRPALERRGRSASCALGVVESRRDRLLPIGVRAVETIRTAVTHGSMPRR